MNNECDMCIPPEKTIDECYNEVLKILTDQGKIQTVSTQLASLVSNHDRALYLCNVLKDLAMLPVIMRNPKNDQVSIYYRCQGNDFFKQRKNFEAWQCYNLSLLYAQPSAENFSYAVSNRSAVFFAMEKYEECIADLNFLFRTTFPEKLRDKLRDRKQRCEAFMAMKPTNKPKDPNDVIIDELLRLKGPRDERYVNASSKLKVVHTIDMGRHVIANENIAVGEILAQEDPFLTVLLQSQFLFTCAYCLSRTMNLYPCLNCTYTMYCSVPCREQAFKAYHIVECSLIPNLLAMEFTKLEWLALRILLRSRTDCSGWHEMFKISEEAEGNVETELWGCVKDREKWVYDSKKYPAVHTLATNVRKRSVSDLFRKALTAAVLTHFLTLLHFLDCSDPVLGTKAKKYVAGSLLRHIMTSPTNMHDVSTIKQDQDGNYIGECSIASGVYPFLSLLNHSCAPNVVRYSKLGSGKMSLIAIRPIKKGMQIFDNYGSHYAVQNRHERQANLSFQYKFTCTCEACVNNWPLHSKLTEAKGLPAHIIQKKDDCLSAETLGKLLKGDKETAVKYFKPLCELIEFLDPLAPCKELSECHEALKQCLAIFEGMIPYGYSEIIPWKAFPPCEAVQETKIGHYWNRPRQ